MSSFCAAAVSEKLNGLSVVFGTLCSWFLFCAVKKQYENFAVSTEKELLTYRLLKYFQSFFLSVITYSFHSKEEMIRICSWCLDIMIHYYDPGSMPGPGPNAKSISVLGKSKSKSYFITDSEL